MIELDSKLVMNASASIEIDLRSATTLMTTWLRYYMNTINEDADGIAGLDWRNERMN